VTPDQALWDHESPKPALERASASVRTAARVMQRLLDRGDMSGCADELLAYAGGRDHYQAGTHESTVKARTLLTVRQNAVRSCPWWYTPVPGPYGDG
jgi:hypothetical protein